MHFTPMELWGQMGLSGRLVVIVMAVMSILSLVVFAERVVFFRLARRHSRRFAVEMDALLTRGDFETAAQSKTGRDVGYLGRTIRAGLAAFSSTASDSREEAMEAVARSLERQAQREVQTLKRGLGLLATIGSTAPFVGLLGTTIGIVTAFQDMGKEGAGGMGTISTGISEALVTTAFGLLVALPAVMAYNGLQSWVDARAVDISEASNEFLDATARALKRLRAAAR